MQAKTALRRMPERQFKREVVLEGLQQARQPKLPVRKIVYSSELVG